MALGDPSSMNVPPLPQSHPVDPDFLSAHRQEVLFILNLAMQLQTSAFSYDISASAAEDVAEQQRKY